jgi:hypothetical protein
MTMYSQLYPLFTRSSFVVVISKNWFDFLSAGTEWTNGYDTGYRGDCVVARQPPCCGSEPACLPTPQSPIPCITRDPNFIPVHNVSATCVCADTYIGTDCSDTIALQIIRKKQQEGGNDDAGCFAHNNEALVLDTSGNLMRRRLSDVQVGDHVGSIDKQGKLSTTQVVFIHDHLEPSNTVILHFLDWAGVPTQYELTPSHAVPTSWSCDGMSLSSSPMSCYLSTFHDASSFLRVSPGDLA